MLFVNQTIKILKNLKYYLQPDTGTTCCTCIRFNKFKTREKLQLHLKGKNTGHYAYNYQLYTNCSLMGQEILYSISHIKPDSTSCGKKGLKHEFSDYIIWTRTGITSHSFIMAIVKVIRHPFLSKCTAHGSFFLNKWFHIHLLPLMFCIFNVLLKVSKP